MTRPVEGHVDSVAASWIEVGQGIRVFELIGEERIEALAEMEQDWMDGAELRAMRGEEARRLDEPLSALRASLKRLD